MMQELVEYLRCPDDRGSLRLETNEFSCTNCQRKFKAWDPQLAELLPSQFPEWNLTSSEPEKALQQYRTEFSRSFDWQRNTGGWGDLSNAAAGVREFYRLEQERMLELLHPSATDSAIDISGASGSYSYYLAPWVSLMVNCDLHVPSLLAARASLRSNSFCIRAPYLKLPIADNSFDCVICVDTLARGRAHELALLREIFRILKPGGRAFFDFHNRKWFHQNHEICEYSINEVRSLLQQADITNYSLEKFGFVPLRMVRRPQHYKMLDILCRLILPCKRYLVSFKKNAG